MTLINISVFELKYFDNVLFDEVESEHSHGQGGIEKDTHHHPEHLGQAGVLRLPAPRRLER